MDFFAAQAQAAAASRWLMAAFAVAVVAVTLATTLAVAVPVLLLREPLLLLTAPGTALSQAAPLLAGIALVVAGTITGASLYKAAALRAGARVIAADLGASRVVPPTATGDERRLLNVVEELAIAATVPVPAVYVLPGRALNAMAAEYGPGRAAVFVTAGCLAVFSRDELQGVLAHEFSHIVHGDARLNTRLVGLVHGLFIVAETGRLLARPPLEPTDGAPPRGGSVAGAWLAAAGLVFAAGFLGLVAGRALQAGVARQREHLADATAVRFARQSRGLRDALVTIGADPVGAFLPYTAVDRVWHMFFAPPGRLDFATHPPLHERIRRLDPSFQPAEIGRRARDLAARGRPLPARETRTALPAEDVHGRVRVPAAGLAALVGSPADGAAEAAAVRAAALPEGVRAAMRDPGAAAGLLLALAIDERETDAALAVVRQRLGSALATAAADARSLVADLPLLERLPAVLLLAEALRELPVAARRDLLGTVNMLIVRGGAPGVFVYALRQLLRRLVEADLPPVRPLRPLSLPATREDLVLLLGVLARQGEGAGGVTPAQAFAAGWDRLGLTVPAGLPPPVAWARPMDVTLRRLARLRLADKRRVIDAMAAVIERDGSVSVAEAELLRLLCAVLDCPLPLLAAAPSPSAPRQEVPAE